MQPPKLGDGTKLSGVVDEWPHRNDMKFNVTKCEVLHLGRANPGVNTGWGMNRR